MDSAVVIQLPDDRPHDLVGHERGVHLLPHFLQRDGSFVHLQVVLQLSNRLEHRRLLLFVDLDGLAAALHGPLDDSLRVLGVFVDVDLGHLRDQSMRLLLHLLGLLLGDHLLSLLLLLRLVKVEGVLQAQLLEYLLEIVVEGVAVPLQTVDHQPEGLDAIPDLYFFGGVQFGMRSADSDQSLEGPDGDGQHLVFVDVPLILIPLPQQVPKLGQQFDGVISELWVDVVLAVRDVSPQKVLFEDLLGLGVGLVDVVLLKDYLVVLGLLVVGVDDVVVVLGESVEGLVHLWGHPVVAADSVGYSLVLLGVLVVQDYED